MGSHPQQNLFSLDGIEDRKVPPFNVALLALSKAKGLGRKSLQALVKAFGDEVGAAFAAPHEKVRKVLQDAKIPGADGIAESVVSDASELIALGKAEVVALAARRIYVIGPCYKILIR